MPRTNDNRSDRVRACAPGRTSSAVGFLWMWDVNGDQAGFDPEAVRAKYQAERDKRLVTGRATIRDLTRDEVFAKYKADPFTPVTRRDPVVEDIDVAIIGAGLAGVVAGAQLRKAGLDRIRLIDNAGGIGGTWYWNRYPGVMCDVESYCYMPMLEETGYIPKTRYAFGDEIREYLEAIAGRFDLADSALFHTGVETSEWDESASRWVIRTDRGDEIRARYLVMAVGILNLMKLPVIPGMEAFEGCVVPFRPLGLRLHRWWSRPDHDEAGRQGRRHHRKRGQRHPGHPATGRVRAAPLCLPAHAGSGRCARQPPHERRLRRELEPGLAPGTQRELPGGDARPGRSTSTSSTTAGATTSRGSTTRRPSRA